MTPPRPTGFGPLSWAWWPVLWAGWGLAAVVMGAEWVAAVSSRPVVRVGKALWDGRIDP